MSLSSLTAPSRSLAVQLLRASLSIQTFFQHSLGKKFTIPSLLLNTTPSLCPPSEDKSDNDSESGSDQISSHQILRLPCHPFPLFVLEITFHILCGRLPLSIGFHFQLASTSYNAFVCGVFLSLVF